MSCRRIKPVSLFSTFSHRQAGCMACLIASGAIGLLTPASQAALLLWNNAGGGSAATAGNWNPSQIPTPADDLQYSLAAVCPRRRRHRVLPHPRCPVIEGAQPFDQIFVDDSVSLNGTLQVNLLNGFSPAVGTQFTIISGLTQVGTFAGFKLERPGPGRNWRVVYDTVNADVKLIVNTCVADVDHNGVVDVDDLIGVILAWGAVPGPCPPFMTGPDTNDSCEVDVDDLIAVILGWGACP